MSTPNDEEMNCRKSSTDNDHTIPSDSDCQIETKNNEVGPDAKDKKNYLSRLDLFFIIFSMFLHPYDIGSDIYLACVYFIGSWWSQFFLTVLSIVMPSILLALFQFLKNQRQTDLPAKRKFIDVIVTLFQLTPLLVSAEYLWYSINAYFFDRQISFRDRKPLDPAWYAQRVTRLLGSIVMMRLVESFVEGIPQISIQVSIAISQLNDPDGPMGGEISWGVIQSVGTSLVSCSWSICFAYKAYVGGSPLTEKSHVSITGLILMFIGYFSLISARFFTLEFLLLTSKPWFFVLCIAHGTLTLTWDTFNNYSDPNFLNNVKSLPNLISHFVRTFGLIFSYVYITQEKLFQKFWIIQIVMLIENFVINTLCFVFMSERFEGVISGDLYSIDAVYVIVIPLIVFIMGLICLYCQNVFWREEEVEGIKEMSDRLQISKEFLFLALVPVQNFVVHENEKSTC